MFFYATFGLVFPFHFSDVHAKSFVGPLVKASKAVKAFQAVQAVLTFSYCKQNFLDFQLSGLKALQRYRKEANKPSVLKLVCYLKLYY